ncbi:MAG: PA2779 family protein [Acidiferrobacterales bacterium]|jgi:hypothetical protein|nr:PA2779 family protein [Acidiferrobacterales bacterium]
MNAFRKMSRTVSLIVVTAFLGLGLHLPAQAAIVGTDATIHANQNSTAYDLLARQDVRDQLVRMGVNPDDAMARINSMSEQEITALNGKLNELPAGGDLVSTVALIFLVLLFTDIMGWTDIFPFVKGKK